MSYAPGAPAAVWALDLDAGCKLTLMALWSKADHEDQRECRACTVWAPGVDGLTPAQALRLALAIQTCQTERAIRRHLSKLRTLGLADAQGRCVSLTAAWHSCPPTGTADHQRADHERARRDRQRAGADHERAPSDHERSLQLNPPVPPLPPNPVDDAHGREALDKCGLCTVDIGGATWRRRIHADCTTHHDISFLGALDVVTPEELTHGDTPPTDRQGAMGAEHPAQGLGGSGPSGPRPASPDAGAGQAGAQAARRPGRPGRCADPPALPAHVEASLARATGAARGPADHRGDSGRAPGVEPRGGAVQHANARLAPDHDLTSEIWAVVIAGGWAHEAEHPMFRQALLETVRDKGLEPADLAQIFARYQISSPMLRPDRSRLFYTRGKLGRKARDFLDRALDREAKPKGGAAWAMDGGLHVVGGAS